MNFPDVIDNSMRKAYASCPTKFMHKYYENIVPVNARTVDLHFGACFARGIEVARKSFYCKNGYTSASRINPVENGISAAVYAWGNFQSPPMSNKTLPRLIGALRYYFMQWPFENEWLTPVEDGIECSFAIDLPIMHPITNLPIMFAGRFDMLATDKNGRYYVVDEKTASKLGDSWIMNWDLDAQMSGYIWAVKQSKIADIEIMGQVRGISILKNDYGHVEVPIVRSKYMIDQWHEQLLHDVEGMIRCWKAKWWDKNLSNACTEYAHACDYAILCKSADPTRLIEGNFKEEIWNPLVRK